MFGPFAVVCISGLHAAKTTRVISKGGCSGGWHSLGKSDYVKIINISCIDFAFHSSP